MEKKKKEIGKEVKKKRKKKKRCQDQWFGPSASHEQEVKEDTQKHNI